MSNKVAIVTYSTAYLPQECLKQYNISVTPLSVIWGDEVCRDGVDILPAGLLNPALFQKDRTQNWKSMGF